MSKQNYEFRALIIGVIINLISAIVGFIFFYLTTSMSILLDGLISAILCGSTIVSIFVSNYVNKNDSKKYPRSSPNTLGSRSRTPGISVGITFILRSTSSDIGRNWLFPDWHKSAGSVLLSSIRCRKRFPEDMRLEVPAAFQWSG